MIVVAGEALIDLIVQHDGGLAAVPGGGPFNTARTIARLGVPVAFLGRLSVDRFGQTLRAALAADGVDLSALEITDAPTTLAIAELDDSGSATYRFHTADTSAPGLSVAAVRAAIASSPAALHVASLGLVLQPMADALAEAVASVGRSTLVSLDPNCRPAVIPDRPAYLARLDPMLGRTDVVKVSTEDLAYLVPGAGTQRAGLDLLAKGPGAVIVTDGPNAVTCLTAGASFQVDVPSVEVVDTVGAGDAFGGAFLARWIERGFGRPELADLDALRDAVELAVRVAALTCRRPGADPPRRHEISSKRALRASVP